jgi:multiple antibiotic resistance protein
VDVRLFGEAFVTLLIIMDPPGTVPIFLALTGGMQPKARNRAAGQAVALAFGVIMAFAVAGEQILRYLQIELPALQGAEGVLLLLAALELLTGKQDDPTQQDTSNVALVPLGTPLLAAPGRSWRRSCSRVKLRQWGAIGRSRPRSSPSIG